MLARMRKSIGIGVAWLGATLLSVFIASAAVAGIRDRVVETPVAIGPPTTSTTVAPPATTATSVSEPTTTTIPVPVTTDAAPTTDAPVTTTTLVDSTTSTTAPPPATTTTTAPPQTTTTVALTYHTYTLIGGTVTLSVGNGEVRVASVAPNAGFDADIEKGGPIEVEVDFESNDHKSELSAKLENGELKVQKEEEPRHGDED